MNNTYLQGVTSAHEAVKLTGDQRDALIEVLSGASRVHIRSGEYSRETLLKALDHAEALARWANKAVTGVRLALSDTNLPPPNLRVAANGPGPQQPPRDARVHPFTPPSGTLSPSDPDDPEAA